MRTFQPYTRIKEQYPEARASARTLIEEGVKAGQGQKNFICGKNRLEGNALGTIAANIADSDAGGDGRRTIVGETASTLRNLSHSAVRWTAIES